MQHSPSGLTSSGSQSLPSGSSEGSLPGTGSLTGSSDAVPESDEAPVTTYSDHSEQILQELQQLNGNLESWFRDPGGHHAPVFEGVTVQVMLSLFFAAFIGGFCLASLSRLCAYAVRNIRKLLGRL